MEATFARRLHIHGSKRGGAGLRGAAVRCWPSSQPSDSRFPLVPNGEKRDRIGVDAMPRNVTAISEINQPFPVLLGQVLNELPHQGMCAKSLPVERWPHPHATQLKESWTEERRASVQGRGSRPGQTLRVAGRRGPFVFSVPTGQPPCHLFGRGVQAGRLKLFPRLEYVSPQGLIDLARTILSDRLAHDPPPNPTMDFKKSPLSAWCGSPGCPDPAPSCAACCG